MASDVARLLAKAAVQNRPRAALWLAGALQGAVPLETAFAQAPGCVGAERLRSECPEGWPRSADEAARCALLVAAAARERQRPFQDVLFRFWRGGDFRAKAAVLRALPLLPPEQASVDVALEGCRSSVGSVFQAIACENPYPAAAFDDAAFSELVVKALFVGCPVSRIAGLSRRATTELGRMAMDFASECLAAGRIVPADVRLILEACP